MDFYITGIGLLSFKLVESFSGLKRQIFLYNFLIFEKMGASQMSLQVASNSLKR